MPGSWVPDADGSGFGIENLPYGVVAASVFGLTYVVLGHFHRQRPIA